MTLILLVSRRNQLSNANVIVPVGTLELKLDKSGISASNWGERQSSPLTSGPRGGDAVYASIVRRGERQVKPSSVRRPVAAYCSVSRFSGSYPALAGTKWTDWGS